MSLVSRTNNGASHLSFVCLQSMTVKDTLAARVIKVTDPQHPREVPAERGQLPFRSPLR
jgi:hypothetical protein